MDARQYLKQKNIGSRRPCSEPAKKMKPDPDRAKEGKSRHYGGKARDDVNPRSYDRDRRHRDGRDRDQDGRHRDYDPHRRIKQKPQDDYESQYLERRQNDAMRIEARRNRRFNPLRMDARRDRRFNPIRMDTECMNFGVAEKTDGSQTEVDRRYREDRDRDQDGRHRNYDPYRRIKQKPQDDYESQHRERRQNDTRSIEARRDRRFNPLRMDAECMNFGVAEKTFGTQAENKPKENSNFQFSGKLTEDPNTYGGVVNKYKEPPEARKPKKRWSLYPVKNDDVLQVLHIHRQSAYLIGRNRLVADIPVKHPSCSKQHAVLQYRMGDLKREDGTIGKRVAPYIIDLGSSKGTYVNNKKIEPRRYVELFERDVIKFGYSSRVYVLLYEMSDTSDVSEAGEAGESP